MERVNTHIVIKKEDALKYLTEVEYQTLERLQTVIIAGRAKDRKKPVNNYYELKKNLAAKKKIHIFVA